MSQQGLRQQSVRDVTGTALDYNGDWSALFDLAGIADGDFNGRMLAWINLKLDTSLTSLPGAMQALAAANDAYNFSSMGTFDAVAFDFVVDGAGGNDGNDGSEALPWATFAPLITAADALPASGSVNVLVKAGTYDENTALVFSGTTIAAGVTVRVYAEPGVIFQGADAADASFVDGAGSNSWTLELYGMGPVKGPSQPRITRWNAGSGNGIGIIGSANIIVRNFQIDDCVDGVSMHGTGNCDAYDLVVSDCSKAPFTHVHTGGRFRAYRCDWIAASGATLGVGSDTHSGAALPSEFYQNTFTPAANLQTFNPGVSAVIRDCVIGSLSASVTLTPATTLDIQDSFVNAYIDGNQSAALVECYGFFTVRHRNGGAGISADHCVFGGGATGAIADAIVAANFNPGANGGVKVIKNTVITGYGTDTVGNGMDATTAAQFLDGGGTVHHCCLFGNTSDFDAQVSADDAFAAAVHDNITSNPMVGPCDTTEKASWAVALTSACMTAGESGTTIGFHS